MISLIVSELQFTLDFSLKHFTVADNAADTAANSQRRKALISGDKSSSRDEATSAQRLRALRSGGKASSRDEATL